MLEYFTYKKVKKHQAEKASRDAAAACEKDPSSTTSSGTATPSKAAGIPLPHTPDLAPSPQPQTMQQDTHSLNIPRKPLPVLTEEDEDFLRGFVDAEDAPEKRPVLPNRPVVDGLKVAGDATGNESQVVLSNKEHGKKETYGEYVGDFVGGIRSRITGKGKEKESDVVLEEEKKDKGKGKENDKYEGGRFGFIGRTFSKKVCMAILQKSTIMSGVYMLKHMFVRRKDLKLTCLVGEEARSCSSHHTRRSRG